MKLFIHENAPVDERTVTIECRQIDRTVQRISDFVRQHTLALEGKRDGKTYRIPVDKILYLETVDKRTFFVTRK